MGLILGTLPKMEGCFRAPDHAKYKSRGLGPESTFVRSRRTGESSEVYFLHPGQLFRNEVNTSKDLDSNLIERVFRLSNPNGI
jgi:hypothetical protein